MLTTRDLIVKWAAYAVVSLLLVLLQTLALHNVLVLGVRMFLPPLLAGIVASMEETRPAVIYGIACGVLCDISLTGTFPCVYTLAFTLASLFASLLARSVLQAGLIRSLAVSVFAFFVVDAFNMAAMAIRAHAPFMEMLDLSLRETLVSCPLLLVCHPVLAQVHKKFTL